MGNDIRFKVRSDTAAAFEANDTLLIQDEIALDTTSKRLKIGDGVTSWRNLSYVKPEIIDNLTTGGSFDALSAAQGVALKGLIDGKADKSTVNALQTTVNNIKTVEVANSLTDNSTTKALSAAQGVALKGLINGKADSSTVNTLQQAINNLNGSVVSSMGVNSNSTAGYIKFTNNWMMQWVTYGPLTFNGGLFSTLFNFPWTFANKCVFVTEDTRCNSNTNNYILTELDVLQKDCVGYAARPLVVNYSAGTVGLDKTTNLSNVYVFVLAIGY